MTILEVTSLLVNLMLIIAAVSGGYYGFRKWIRTVSRPLNTIQHQLETNNGHTIAQAVEGLKRDVKDVKTETSSLLDVASENNDLAKKALDRANHAHERLDAFLAGIQLKE